MIRHNLAMQLALPTLLVALVAIGTLVLYAGSMARERALEQIVETDWTAGDVASVHEAKLRAEDVLVAAEDTQSKLLLGGGLLSLALIAFIVAGIRRIDRRLEETVAILDRVAEGDLEIAISSQEPDPLRGVNSALEVAIAKMRGDMESLHRSQVLMESIPVNLLFCDPEHVVTYANPACHASVAQLVNAVGMEAGKIEGRSVEFLFGGDEPMREVLESTDWLPYRGVRTVANEAIDLSVDIIEGLDGERLGSLITFKVVTEEEQNAVRLREAMEAERESGDRLRESMERELERADAEGLIATEMRLKADRISEVVVAAANGDLTQRIRLEGETPMDQISKDLDDFLDDLTMRIMQIREVSTELAATGHEVDKVGKSLVVGARRTSEEVSSVARAWIATGEGVDSIGGEIQNLASSYADIKASAADAAEVVTNGVTAAHEARQSISELDRSTEEIQIILTVIDQIADQSKLLALNASIEAARAGESGRGFNVVAQEVKKLATRTEDATRQIAQTVAQILERGGRSAGSIRAMGDVMDRVAANQTLVSMTMDDQQQATRSAEAFAEEIRSRSSAVASSIDQLRLVAESTEADAAGTDREANKLFELANQIGALTSRFVC